MLAGDAIGSFRLIRFIAKGGMGEVWEAARGEERVALKTLVPEAQGDPALLRRLLDEAKVGAMLDHRNIVRTLETGLEGTTLYVALELLRGRSFSDLVKSGPLPAGLVLGLGAQILEGLSHAQEVAGPDGRALRVVHRDIKPSNLFATDAGIAKIIDFGIAKASALDTTTTRSGVVRGSLAYLSPEQARGESIDGRSDLFALGLVFHEMLTGKRVFGKQGEAQVLAALLFDPISRPSELRPEVSPALDAFVMGLVAREVEKRPANAAAALAILRAELASEPWAPATIASWLAEHPPVVRPSGFMTATLDKHGVEVDLEDGPHTVGERPTTVRKRRRFYRTVLPGVLAIALGGGGIALYATREQPPELPPPRSTSGTGAGPAVPAEPLAAIAHPDSPKTEPSKPGLAPTPVKATRKKPPGPVPAPHPAVTEARPAEPAAVKEVGWLTVDVRPTWAEVFVDGRSLGPSPLFHHPLQPGPHAVEAVRADGSRKKADAKVASGREEKLVLEW
jgi:serine/threonine-protein kinase